MSVAGINSTSFSSPNAAYIQNQQRQAQQQSFQSLAQEFQTGTLMQPRASLPQAVAPGPSANGTIDLPGGGTAAANGPSSAGTLATAASSTLAQATTQETHGHVPHRRHLGVEGGPEPDGATSSTSHGQLGQTVQAGSASSVERAYGSVQQGLTNALNSDLITAQSAALEASTISLTA